MRLLQTCIMERRDFVKTGLAAGTTAVAAPMAVPLMGGGMPKGAFVHCVYFWMNDGLTDEQIQSFKDGLQSLIEIESVRHGFFGTPADTDRPIIDRSYSYGLVVVFDDKAGHDAYQVDPVHDTFRESSDLWKEVRIFDFVVG